MKRVEFFFAMLPDEIRAGRFFKSRWRMTREDAARHGGTVIENTIEVRDLPETQEELDAFHGRPSWGRRPD
jgi:hypothetical protein